MDFITIKEASEKWGLSTRRILSYCTEGRIPGAEKRGRLWVIPAHAQKPVDGRMKKSALAEPSVLLGNATYLETHSAMDVCDYDRAVCNGLLLFLQGNFDESLRVLKRLTRNCDDKQYLLIGYALVHYAAVLNGDITAKKAAYDRIRLLFKDPEVGELTKLMVSSRVLRLELPPDIIFRLKNPQLINDLLPIISLESLRHNLTYALRTGHLESLVSQEITCYHLTSHDNPQMYVYYNIVLAVYYTITGYEQYAKSHLEAAARVALPRKWYTPFAEYALSIDLRFIDEIDHDAFVAIGALTERINLNRMKINPNSSKKIRFSTVTIKDFQVAYLIACGKSNAEIAETLGMSTYAVKLAIASIYARSGFTKRTQIRQNVMEYIFL